MKFSRCLLCFPCLPCLAALFAVRFTGPLLISLVMSASAFAQSKADPSTWILWRAAPIDFPDNIAPRVPEKMQGEPPIDFQNDGSDLTIIMPDAPGDDFDSKALDWTRRFIVDKVRKARVVAASKVTAEDLQHHLLLLGTVRNNSFAQRVLGDAASAFTKVLRPGGYRIKAVEHPTLKTKRAIVALGVDMKGAYSAGAVLCHAIHANKEGSNGFEKLAGENSRGLLLAAL